MNSMILKWTCAAGLVLLLSARLPGPARGGQAPEVAGANGLNVALLDNQGQHNCQSCHAAPVTVAQVADANRITNLKADALRLRLETPLLAVFHDPADAALGATLEPVSDALRAQLGIPGGQGLVVVSLAGDGPAAEAGLKQNDILLNLADKPLASTDDLPKQLKAAGEAPVSLRLVRSGKPVTVQVRPVYRVTLGPVGEKKSDYYIGVSVAHPDDALRAHVELPAGVGLVANEVVSNSPAEKVGVKIHDILLELDGKPLDSPETLVAQVQAARNNATPLKLLRAGKPLTLSITPELRPVEPAPYHEAMRFWSVNQPFHPHAGLNPAGHPWGTLRGNLWYKANEDPADKRLDRLDQELKALRQAIDELRDSFKADRAKGRD
jgi:serine protease Do